MIEPVAVFVKIADLGKGFPRFIDAAGIGQVASAQVAVETVESFEIRTVVSEQDEPAVVPFAALVGAFGNRAIEWCMELRAERDNDIEA